VALETEDRSGRALGVEAKVNLYELGLTKGNVSAGAWYKDREAGYSTARAESAGLHSREAGVELVGQVAADLDVGARLSRRETDAQASIEQAQLVGNWRLDDVQSVGLELRRIRSAEPGGDFTERDEAVRNAGQGIGTATYMGLRYKRKFGGQTEGYAFVQSTLQSDETLKNDRFGLGATR
jgi:hypothetical protein